MGASWTSEDEKQLRGRWKALTVEEIRSHKKVAQDKIAEALAELYLATGIYFAFKGEVVTTDELDSQTQWIARYTQRIDLSGHI